MLTKTKDLDLRHFALIIIPLLLMGVFCWIGQFSLIIPIVLLFLGVHVFYSKKGDLKLFLNLGLLLTLIVFTAHTLVKYTDTNPYYIPVASVAMLVILLYNDLHLAFLMAFAASALVSIMIGYDFNFMLIFFIGGLMAVYVTKDARTRGEFMKTGLFVSLIQVICIALLNPSKDILVSNSFLRLSIYPLLVNGFISALVVMATLKIFEWLFEVVTNFSLLELSDFNQPLLKRMVLEAPGTYHHSLIVSNMAEAAASVIGANSLLARVGAYYHDVGKMVKPEYFTENQMVSGNKHEKLEPSMSRLVILNHVKEGMELARKNKLSEQIIDFIPQHHGTSLIYYFYQKALEGAQEDEKVDEKEFRYPGPKPQTRESAVVLLADSVEGAVRALGDPNPNRIEEAVRKIINNKFIDGQLDECELTLKDIDKIGTTFSRVLGAMYHTRIQYPERKDENGNTNRKSSEKNSSKIQPNTQGSKRNPKV